MAKKIDMIASIKKDIATLSDGYNQYQKMQVSGYTTKAFSSVGVEFEHLVIRQFELCGLDVAYPFSNHIILNKKKVEIEQIDGVVYLNSIPFIVESKFHETDKIDIEPIAKLYIRLLKRPSIAFGLVFTNTGLTGPAIEYMKYLHPKNIILWQGTEVELSFMESANTTLKKDMKYLLHNKLKKLIEKGDYESHVAEFI